MRGEASGDKSWVVEAATFSFCQGSYLRDEPGVPTTKVVEAKTELRVVVAGKSKERRAKRAQRGYKKGWQDWKLL